jgi:hypothetical protein
VKEQTVAGTLVRLFKRITGAIFIDERVLGLDERERENVRAEFRVTRDRRETENTCARSGRREHNRQILRGRRAKIKRRFRHRQTIMLRGIVSISQQSLVCGSMRVGQRVAMVGSKEIVCDAFGRKEERRKMVPSPLAETSFEMMGATITPNLNGIKATRKKIGREKKNENIKNEKEIVFVVVLGIANIVNVFFVTLTTFDKFHHQN